MKKKILCIQIGLITLFLILFTFQSLITTDGVVSFSPSSYWHIQGTSVTSRWGIDVTISVGGNTTGTFEADGVVWDDVQYVYKTPGLGGYPNMIWLLGRKDNNYILLFVYAHDVGSEFGIWYFNYKGSFSDGYSSLLFDYFSGSYNVSGGITPNPAVWSFYVPFGKVPYYRGYKFEVSSINSEVTPENGVVRNILNLNVYPIYNVVVDPTWSEFWAIGIDPSNNHTYHLIYYTNSSRGWVIDLWNGRTEAMDIGQATLFGENVDIKRNVILAGYKVSGYVKSQGVAMAGAQVTLDGQSIITDETGYYEFVISQGHRSYNIVVSTTGYETYYGTVFVGATDNQYNISLTKVPTEGAGIPLIIGVVVILCCIMGGITAFTKKKRAQ